MSRHLSLCPPLASPGSVLQPMTAQTHWVTVTLKVASAACASLVLPVAMAPSYFCRRKPKQPRVHLALGTFWGLWKQLLLSPVRAALATRAAEEGANSPLSSCSPLPLAFRESDTLVSEITLACCQAKQQFPHYPPERNRRGPRKKSRGLSFKVSLVCHLGKAKFLESTA